MYCTAALYTKFNLSDNASFLLELLHFPNLCLHYGAYAISLSLPSTRS